MTEDLQSQSEVLLAFKPMEHFCKSMLDAYAVIDTKGRVIKSNQLLSTLLGIPTKQILRLDSLQSAVELTLAGQPLTIDSFLSHGTPMRFDEVQGKIGTKSGYNLIIGASPLFYGEKVVGVFLLIRDVTAETNLQGKYIDKATQSITDGLTSLYNRKYFFEFLDGQLNTLATLPVEAPQRLLSVLMFDLDHFKSVNDVHGHQAGDIVIRETAKIIKQMLRKTDLPARYGGEEFVALLPGTDLMGALIAAEKIRKAVESFSYDIGSKILPVTVSIGVAQIKVGEETGEKAIARADEALYHSKHSGRNRVSCHAYAKAIGIADFLESMPRSA